MPMVCEISDCSRQGMCRGWSRDLGAPRRGWCRWCASQHAAAAQGMCRGWSRHLCGPWYQLPPMVCEPASRPSQAGAEASARTMAQLVPMVSETGAPTIDCLKWGHFFQTGSRMHHGPAGADGVRARRPQLSQACPEAVLRTKSRRVKASARTMSQLLRMECEPATCSSARHVPRQLEVSARTMSKLLPMVCEAGARSIECLKWGHFFHTAIRMHQGSSGADGVRASCSPKSRHVPRQFCAPSRCWSRHLLAPWPNCCRWCARQLPVAAQGMCGGWSRHPRGPWCSCCRWCARQPNVASSV